MRVARATKCKCTLGSGHGSTVHGMPSGPGRVLPCSHHRPAMTRLVCVGLQPSLKIGHTAACNKSQLSQSPCASPITRG